MTIRDARSDLPLRPGRICPRCGEWFPWDEYTDHAWNEKP